LPATASVTVDCAHAQINIAANADGFFNSRRVQIANLAARDRIPAAYRDRGYDRVVGARRPSK
jgi:hypothetical protein